ncbi:sugar synthetase [cyanobiont of Ornithocercus magnificus]|nr:sugar synthetase [cyanobiont of Ornithocercus magnificus]
MICNGHGEDVVALKVLESLHWLVPDLPLQVLPLVGEGRAFTSAARAGWLQVLEPLIHLPSGGFSNQGLSNLLVDLRSGLLSLTWKQWQVTRHNAAVNAAILAVGDLFPLFLAWSSGGNYGFIGTPKSDYTWRSGPGHSLGDVYHRLKGSEWDPWEWTLMQSNRCQMVAVRDQLTARGLRQHHVPAQALGNPVMDGLKTVYLPSLLEDYRRIIVLCGSRMPEAHRNFKHLLKAISKLKSSIPVLALVATSEEPSEQDFHQDLVTLGYACCPSLGDATGATCCYIRRSQLVLIGSGCFMNWASWAEVGIATAGTATEQLVGLGIPALSLPGPGPQFTWAFAQRQSRLLGGAVRPCTGPEQLTKELEHLLADASLRHRMGSIGRYRMGSIGGSERLARQVASSLLLKRP